MVFLKSSKLMICLRLIVLLISSLFIQDLSAQGSLFIAGGGLVPGNQQAYSRLVELAGGPARASFAVIPTASGVPYRSFSFIRETLARYGVSPDRVILVPVASALGEDMTDHDSIPWTDNGDDPALADLVRKCTGVWFTGGDQVRITRALIRPDGARTAVLDAIWEVYHNGGVVGGTSAGTAIMSGVMIGNGSSLGALKLDYIKDNGPENEETDALLLTTGLGFFPEGIVDQHFTARARLGRLAMALVHSGGRARLGFGVDENTVMVYSASDRTISVTGNAGVTIIDAGKASVDYHGGLPAISGLSVSYIGDGDAFSIPGNQIIPAAGKNPTRGNEYYQRPNPGQGGILSPNGATFTELITINLMDNKAADTVTNLSMAGDGTGFLLTFSKNEESQGFYAESEDEEDLYSVYNIRLDIRPVSISIIPIKE